MWQCWNFDDGQLCDIESGSSSTEASPLYCVSLTLEQEGAGSCGNRLSTPTATPNH